MQVDNKLLDDLARVAGGAIGALTGLRGEVEAQVRQARDSLRKLQQSISLSAFAEAVVTALEAIAIELADLRREVEERPRTNAR